MKTLKIFQENCLPIEVCDDDDKDLESYIKELTNIVELDNITILHLSNDSLILRPSKILSIVVSEKENIIEVKPKSKKPKKEKIKKEDIPHEDVITDMD